MSSFQLRCVCTMFLAVIGTAGFLSDGVFAQEVKLSSDQTKFFETKIRPVLVRECYGCHSTKSQVRGGLWLDTREGTLAGGDSGPAVVPGDLDESLLWNAINHEDYNMPPGKKMSSDIIADFKKWIEMGAPDPRVQKIAQVNSTITIEDIENGREFWSFKKPVPQTVPSADSNWPVSDIDRFVYQKLRENDLEPSKDTDASIFLRRLSFDLVGLPPTPEQVAWLNKRWDSDRESAIAHIVDSLLAKEEYGERWGRHWLDVARYAESSGKELNLTYPTAWRYRDYVIDSFNDDKPYDRFIQEQVAGDLLPVKTDEQWAENLVATGFLAMGPKTLTEQNGRQFELDLIDEQIDVTSRVVMGVSVACARCHDHKFDPIPQADYYAVAGIFKSTSTHYGTIDTFQNRRPSNLLILPVSDSYGKSSLSKSELDKLKSELGESQRKLAEIQRERRAARNGQPTSVNAQQLIAQFARVSTEVAAIRGILNEYDENGDPLTFAMGVQELDKPVDARLLERGEFDKPGQMVDRGFPTVLVSEQPKIKSKSSGRLELARWMTSEDHPLTARVMVNRIWQHMFGNGLVRTPENFGATGLPPTHPELLDHLAIDFMENGWSVKTLIRKIATSRVYRTRSEFDKKSFEADPENKLVWRMEPRRLDAEALRDSILRISGELDSERPRASTIAGYGYGMVRNGVVISSTSSSNNEGRGSQMGMRSMSSNGGSVDRVIKTIDQPSSNRSVYLPVIRDNVVRSLDVFDFAEPSMVVGKREQSNTPDQGLYFLNNEFVIQQSDAMAARILKEKDGLRDRIEYAFLLAYGRKVTPGELGAAETFYKDFKLSKPTSSQSSNRFARFRNRFNQSDSPSGATTEKQRLSALCQAILASAEFRYLN